jgi:ATP-dependent RNA helicase DeaD
VNNFLENSFPLSDSMRDALIRLGFQKLTAVQELCIPQASAGRDILAQASTGSGKTAAYLIPVLESLPLQSEKKHSVQALILCPSRELAMQIAEVSRTLLSGREGIRTALLCGGTDLRMQIRSFHNGADVVVGTPGRVLEHLRRHTLKPQECRKLVLDEADEMLSMGFLESIRTISGQLPDHQTMLFSATYPEPVQNLARSLLHDPFECHLASDSEKQQHADQYYLFASGRDRLPLLRRILKEAHPAQAIVFCNTRHECDGVQRNLSECGFTAETIHSEMDQKVRTRIMKSFRAGSLPVLVATDVAARGLDIGAVELVINLEFPDEAQSYVHRIGRTGRREKPGKAVTFLAPGQNDKRLLMKQLTGQDAALWPQPAAGKKQR